MSKTLKFLPPPKPHRGKENRVNPIGVTETAAAKTLGISRRIIRAGIKCGDIKTVAFANRLYIPHSEIERIRQMFSPPSQ